MGKIINMTGVLLALIAAVVLSSRERRFWAVFGLDYLLGPQYSSFESYVARESAAIQKSWGINPNITIPPQSFNEITEGGYSFEAFRDITDGYTKPVIIRGLFRDAQSSKWTPQNMADHFGEDREFVSFSNNRMGSSSGKTHWTTVQNFKDNVTNGGDNYIFNANFLHPDDVPLVHELELERLDFEGKWREPAVIQFFLGLSRGVGDQGKVVVNGKRKRRVGGSPLHAAIAPNLNMQISGVKKWVMVAPEYSKLLRPTLLSTQFATLAGISVDTFEGDRYNYVPRYEGTVYPGDAIFIPPWYYHEVSNQAGIGNETCDCEEAGKCNGQDECTDAWQISTALRIGQSRASYWNNWWFTLLSDLGVRGKPCPPGLRMLCIDLAPPWIRGTSAILKHKVSTAGLEAEKIMKRTASDAAEDGRFE